MNNTIKFFIALAILIINTKVYAIDHEYCAKLESKIADKKIREQLLSWVDGHFINTEIPLRRVSMSSYGIRPGDYTLKGHGFDWNLLEFNPETSQVKLIGLQIFDFFESADNPINKNKSSEGRRKPANSSDVDSIFFAERRYYGIVVKLKDSDQFVSAKYQKYLTLVSDRVGVLCGSKYIRGD